jgi:hypothetical protein
MARPFGLGYLIFTGVVGAVAGVSIFAPEVPRGWFATPALPSDEGAAPRLTGEMQVDLAAKEHEAALQQTVRIVARPNVTAEPVAQPAPTATAVAPKIDAQAGEQLAEIERLYRAYQWNAAESGARKLLAKELPPAVRVRAKDIAACAIPVGLLFGKLNDRDELARNFDTNPSLVTLSGGRAVTYAVPIESSSKDAAVVTRDPLGWIAHQRQLGQVPFLIRGAKGFIATELPDASIGTVQLVDQNAVRAEKLAKLEGIRANLTGPAAQDPIAWYELGRYAYQNRLDAYVVDALHQAILLDPNLATTVREDRAGVLFANLMAHLNNGNKTQAAAVMALIERKYKDTEPGRQARLLFDGKTSELVAAAKEAQRKAAEEDARRLAAAQSRAAETGTISTAPAEPPEEPAVATITGSASETKAAALYDQGAKLCSEAIDKGNTPERDRLYGEAIKVLQQAIPLLSQLAAQEKDPTKREALEAKLIQANQMKFGATKMRRLN